MHVQSIQKILSIKLLVLIGLCICTNNAQTQTLSATLNRDKILIGEQVVLELKADGINLQQYQLKQWFNVADTFNSFEIVQRNSLDTIKIGSNTGFVQKFVLTSFDSGYWQIPSFDLVLQNKLNDSLINFSTNSLYVTVLPVNVDSLQDFHDIKDIETVENYVDWKFLIAIALALIIAFFVFLWFRSKKKIQPTANNFSNQPAHQWALAQIDLLLQEQHLEKGNYKIFYSQLIQICRTFTDSELKMLTQHTTIDEYMLAVKGRLGNENMQTQYFQLLRLSNVVKFAKYVPTTTQSNDAVNTAVTLIHTLHKISSKA